MKTSFLKALATSIITSAAISAYSQTDTLSVYEMSLEDLMNVQVATGSLVSTSQFMTPSAVTTITSEEIEKSAYRNLMDLIEAYVPGAFYMEHPSEGQKLGMRGIIADRNLKFLLLINGMVIGDRGHRGVMSEIAM